MVGHASGCLDGNSDVWRLGSQPGLQGSRDEDTKERWAERQPWRTPVLAMPRMHADQSAVLLSNVSKVIDDEWQCGSKKTHVRTCIAHTVRVKDTRIRVCIQRSCREISELALFIVPQMRPQAVRRVSKPLT